ncbi:unnamed protein product [Onchocerca flexuosa]|uniref:CPXV012 protein n=1 Tax=Onchocerca flexuosa TaxID=387005 RepID=A0A183I3Q8_9BILA|nr:unnamed protein product [Onchocerca flexuosa]
MGSNGVYSMIISFIIIIITVMDRYCSSHATNSSSMVHNNKD